MTRTVDLVIVGGHPAAVAAAVEALSRGLRVAVVERSRPSRLSRDLHEAARSAGEGAAQRLTVLTGAEIVCVDGVRSIEAVLVRQLRTRRLIAFNAPALRVFQDGSES